MGCSCTSFRLGQIQPWILSAHRIIEPVFEPIQLSRSWISVSVRDYPQPCMSPVHSSLWIHRLGRGNFWPYVKVLEGVFAAPSSSAFGAVTNREKNSQILAFISWLEGIRKSYLAGSESGVAKEENGGFLLCGYTQMFSICGLSKQHVDQVSLDLHQPSTLLL